MTKRDREQRFLFSFGHEESSVSLPQRKARRSEYRKWTRMKGRLECGCRRVVGQSRPAWTESTEYEECGGQDHEAGERDYRDYVMDTERRRHRSLQRSDFIGSFVFGSQLFSHISGTFPSFSSRAASFQTTQPKPRLTTHHHQSLC